MAKLSSYIKSGSLASSVSGFSTVPPLIVGGTTETGTSSQNLQVTGGGYFSSSVGINTVSPIGNLQVNATTSSFVVTGVGSVGIGLTNPRFKLEVGAVGASGTSLYVNGDARVTGILSVGQGTITINGNADKITAPKFEYAGISSTITATAVDVFVYDTRKDSDGGAWRKRTQHTSWYNETLNTATRGSRRDFPAVAVIVCAATSVTIYDGDDPDLPMWMVFNRASSAGWTPNTTNILGVSYSTFTSISMLNGIFAMGADYSSDNTNGVLIKVSFIEDTGYFHSVNSVGASYPAGGFGKYRGSIAERDSGKGHININDTDKIVNVHVNDVAMTVLPNAPIDSTTGLPIPTIAVATAGGASVIKDDGTVANIGGTVTTKIDINQNLIFTASTANGGYYGFTVDGFSSINAFFNTVGNLRILSNVNNNTNNNLVVPNSSNLYSGQTVGLSLVYKNGLDNSDYNGMVAYATTSYATGWMHGNIKGAFLSDTSTTSVTGTELVTNGDFASGTTGWTGGTGGTLSVTSGVLRVTNTATNGRAISNTFSTVVGKKYVLTADGVTKTTSNYYMEVRGPEVNTTWASGTGVLYFTAVGTTTYVELYALGSGSTYSEYDNVSVRIVEDDRSVNNKGLQVFGTITKTAVATGADLVAYGGFSISNYLLQPYNSAIAFGTADFSYMGWAKATTAGGYLFQWDNPNSASGIRISMFNSTTVRVTVTSVVDRDITYSALTGTWNFFVVQRVGSIIYTYINGVQIDSFSNTTNLSGTDKVLTFGYNGNSTLNLALWRVSATAPSPDQIKKIYNDEKMLFQENSKATLYGTSSAVTALAYDDSTRLLYAGTSSGRSDFQGLERINNTTTAVTTAISASNGLVAEQ